MNTGRRLARIHGDPQPPQRVIGGRETRGFTLIELMVVMAIIAILAVLALPQYRVQLIAGRLEEAKPYLLSVAAAQRVYFNRSGAYLAASDEQTLEDTLGVDLRDAANFCLIVVTNNFITNSANTEFEVWAVLRKNTDLGDDTTTVDSTAVICTAADEKRAATGWVQDGGEIGGEGRVVVLRYPEPGDGPDLNNLDVHRSAATVHDWVSGISSMDALQP